ncbi:peroxisomal sarcosine oxidase-like isoform X2 [Dendronephthya gigantea]|uniref:peroxisomal sarcosine oxidase-like isoform X2 n=1 Tax=Dendronephthya gigantea TaxID=151771 RepID=UPI00106AD383|nr:peroxisomal sarcosine oxidase-like isoform X2 [Dendronephthya gigantea]
MALRPNPVNNKELKEKYMFNYPPDMRGLLEPTGGILLANKCLQAVQSQFKEYGGVLQDNEKVMDIIPGNIVQVKTSKGLYKTRRLILTPGPWANSLLKPLGMNLDLKPVRTTVFYWKVKQSGFAAEDNYPCFADYTSQCLDTFGGLVYGLPCYEYPGMIKFAIHGGPIVDPDARDMADHTDLEKNASEYVSRHIMGVEARPSIVEHCIYSVSPDDNCILDQHPQFHNIVIGVGFSDP